ncbi:hypothetical protein HA052_18805 [Chromobacterium haemolyticum]|uniref:Uncharacterized protein n=1 Tax=Chromobacterium fluminis TaxID=3044269 RepID=A0ABX0LCJ6_9NEIS|nr:hypothetical protein [Chromobacterium haemolyticum]NHR07244.1 hypothetical protein [Chromobacterium haemolyticum]
MRYFESNKVVSKLSGALGARRWYGRARRVAGTLLCSVAMIVTMMPVRADPLEGSEYEIKTLPMRTFTFFQRQQVVFFLIKKLTDRNDAYPSFLKVCDGERYVVGYKEEGGYAVAANRDRPLISVSPKGDTVGDGYASGVYRSIKKGDELIVRVPVRLTTPELTTTSGNKFSLGINDIHPFDRTCRVAGNLPTVLEQIKYDTLSDEDATPIIVPLDWKEQRVASDSSFIASVRILGALKDDVVKWKGSDGADVLMTIGDPILDRVDHSNIGYSYTAKIAMPTRLDYHASVELSRKNKIKSQEQVISSVNDESADSIGKKPMLDVHDCNPKQRCTLTWRATIPYRVTPDLGVSLSAFRKNAELAKKLPEEIFSLDHRSAWQNHHDFGMTGPGLLPAINRVYYRGNNDSLLTHDTVMPHSGDFTLMFEPVGGL